jgi:hypothetical protein
MFICCLPPHAELPACLHPLCLLWLLQPGGFQYILRYTAHSADITAVGLATKLKLAAVADASGCLSLVDLLQPAQLFSTRAMQQPVAALAFGSHVIPGPKEEPGVER